MDALSPLFLVVLVGGFYALAIRPQKARMKALQQAQAALTPGQRVMTTAGLYGTVAEVGDDDVSLEVAPGVQLRFARGAVAKVVVDPVPEPDLEPAELDAGAPSPVTPG